MRLTIDRDPSASQTLEYWLIADGDNLSLGTRQGYLLRLGTGTASQPEPGFELIRQSATGSRAVLATVGRGLCVAGADLTVYAARGRGGRWWLGIDSADVPQPHRGLTVADPAPDGWQLSRSWVGVCLPHTTGSGVGGYLIDSLAVGPVYVDLTPPQVSEARILGSRVEVRFSEPIDTLAPWQLTLDPTTAVAQGRWRWQAGGRQAMLVLTGSLPEGGGPWALVWQARDRAGLTGQGRAPLEVIHEPTSGDLVLTEIKPGAQTPPGGWPACTWLEIENLTGRTLMLDSVGIAVNEGVRRYLPAGSTLGPRGRAVLTSTACAAVAGWQGVPGEGRVWSVPQMPGLPDAGATIVLGLGRAGILDRARYHPSQWSPSTDLPFYSLERIDPSAPCGGGRGWGQSTDPRGGTPGAVNAINGVYRDVTPPSLVRQQLLGGGRLVLTFDEPLVLTLAGGIGRVMVAYPGVPDGTAVPALAAQVDTQTPERLLIDLEPDLLPRPGGPPLTLTISGLADCPGNVIDPPLVLTIKLSRAPSRPGELWISEVLAHPFTNGESFVEICNLTSDDLTLLNTQLRLRQGQAGGPPGSPIGQRVDSVDLSVIGPIEAGGCRYVSRVTSRVELHYPRARPGTGVGIPLPTLPRLGVHLELIGATGRVLDRATPRQENHSPALTQTQGVSLQRHLPDRGDTAESLSGGRWHSTARTDGYATPGFRPASQLEGVRARPAAPGRIAVEPAVITPNGDDRQDRTRVSITLPKGWGAGIATVEVLTPEGVTLGTLARAESVVNEAHWWWEGRAPGGGRLPPGPYVILGRVQPATGGGAPLRLRAVVGVHY